MADASRYEWRWRACRAGDAVLGGEIELPSAHARGVIESARQALISESCAADADGAAGRKQVEDVARGGRKSVAEIELHRAAGNLDRTSRDQLVVLSWLRTVDLKIERTAGLLKIL